MAGGAPASPAAERPDQRHPRHHPGARHAAGTLNKPYAHNDEQGAAPATSCVRPRRYPSAVIGSITAATRVTTEAGKPLRRECSWMSSSEAAM